MTTDEVDWWIRSKSVEELISRAGRCTELSCPYHGAFNRELRRRRLEREAAAVVDQDEEVES